MLYCRIAQNYGYILYISYHFRSGFDYSDHYWNCHRNDNRSLIKEWEATNPNGKVVYYKDDLADENLMAADKVRGKVQGY